MSHIETAEAFWDSLAREDPLWAILSDSTRHGRGWNLDAFFQSGEREVSTLIYRLESLAGKIGHGFALDFGCGVGRLTQALAKYFGHVVGVDVSSVMIKHAQRLNQHGDAVTFVHNRSEDLSILRDRRFDLIYSDLVFQHLPPQITTRYMDECLERLEPRGLFVFQLPSHPRAESQPIIVPMPPSAYRSHLQLIEGPDRWAAGSHVSLRVRVVNDSTHTWDQGITGAIRLGNHWLSGDGSMLVQDDGRSALPAVMKPGEQADVSLDVVVPSEGGQLLELDLVQEGFSWFRDRGAETVRLDAHVGDPVVVRDDSRRQPTWGDSAIDGGSESQEATAEVPFPMYAIQRDEVLEHLEQRGAEVLLVENDDRGGPEWAGFRYFTRRPA
jgi:SAM-dependent methyltransferase